ncbi:Ribonuclease Z [Vibrio stylophorae]|uniref:Ribonuclease Z n=1 Tax=Vibrio stylophorae TaxID=659351 RepID=A0ABM8ZUJ5_9VIBR|nr:MBL fold metallo-hydrolase [Vibrio stylophorae]CAH0533622.1 Ribonuclease Z [Vibrio stylophorae]
MIELIMLGTSAGTPTKHRNVSAMALRRYGNKNWCLVDCGEGTQHQILHTSLSLSQLELVCITHVHGDHCYGLLGLLASAAMAGRTLPLTIIAPQAIQLWFEQSAALTELHLSFEMHWLDVACLEQSQQNYRSHDFVLDVVALAHRVPSYGFGFSLQPRDRKLNIEKLKADAVPTGPIWSQLQKGYDVPPYRAEDYLRPAARGQKIMLCGDNAAPNLLHQMAQYADALVHEATYTQAVADKVGQGPMHSSALNIARFAECAQIPNLLLTHFSSRYHTHGKPGATISDIESEARMAYAGTLFLAEDFACYHLNRSGQMVRVADAKRIASK